MWSTIDDRRRLNRCFPRFDREPLTPLLGYDMVSQLKAHWINFLDLQHIFHEQVHQLICLFLSLIFMKMLLSNKLLMNIYIALSKYMVPPRQLTQMNSWCIYPLTFVKYSSYGHVCQVNHDSCIHSGMNKIQTINYHI